MSTGTRKANQARNDLKPFRFSAEPEAPGSEGTKQMLRGHKKGPEVMGESWREGMAVRKKWL